MELTVNITACQMQLYATATFLFRRNLQLELNELIALFSSVGITAFKVQLQHFFCHFLQHFLFQHEKCIFLFILHISYRVYNTVHNRINHWMSFQSTQIVFFLLQQEVIGTRKEIWNANRSYRKGTIFYIRFSNRMTRPLLGPPFRKLLPCQIFS